MLKGRKKVVLDSIIIGAALFSMYFGAGNMIFPPYLGFKSGTDWFSGFLGYYIADIGLAVVAILAQIRVGGHEKFLSPLGKFVGPAMMFAVVMCVGPIISIPRTAATTYELSIAPLFEGFNMPLFYILFFAVVALLCINQSAVVDIIGKILTPVLFVGLIFLIVMGLINPMGNITLPPRTESVIADGIGAGYQSIDVLASVIFGVIILSSATDKGHTDKKSKSRVAAGAGIAAGIGLLVIYLGLTYLGATASSGYNMHIDRTSLLTSIISTLMPGTWGLVFFAVVSGLACLSTAIALTTSAAEYLEGLTKGKIKYKYFVIGICLFDAIISLAGVEMLITFAAPILEIVYPPILMLVITSFLPKKIGDLPKMLSAFCAMLFAVLGVVSSFGVEMPLLRNLPLSSLGLGWLLPSVAIMLIGIAGDLLFNKKRNQLENNS